VASAHVHLDTAGSQIVELTIPEAPRPVVARPLPAPTDPAERADHLGAVALVADAPQHTEHHEIYEEWWLWTIVGVVVVGAGVGITAGAIASEGTTLPRGSLGTIDGRP
jgi:acetyltransferase-like isoleucine patch superfamily enzyme